MKIRTSLSIISITCALALGALWIDRNLFPLFSRVNRTVSSQYVWERLQTLQTLSTLRYIKKVVFPYDYLHPSIDFNTILTTLRKGKGTVESLLRPEERDYLEARDLSERIGLKFTGSRREFVVVTARVSLGIDLKAATVHSLSPTSVRISLPPPGIMDLSIEDPNPATYPYPDLPLSPESWKLIASFVERKIKEQPLEGRLVDTAREGAVKVITTLFSQAGFSQVEIEELPPKGS